MKYALVLSLFVATSALAGQSGGGTGMVAPDDLIRDDVVEIINVYKGATTISKDLFGTPNNFTLDSKNRIVNFEDDVQMTFEEVSESTHLPQLSLPGLHGDSLLKQKTIKH